MWDRSVCFRARSQRENALYSTGVRVLQQLFSMPGVVGLSC